MVDFAKMLVDKRRKELVTAIAIEMHIADRVAASPPATPADARQQGHTFARHTALAVGHASGSVLPAVRYWREVEGQAATVLTAIDAAGFEVVRKEN